MQDDGQIVPDSAQPQPQPQPQPASLACFLPILLLLLLLPLFLSPSVCLLKPPTIGLLVPPSLLLVCSCLPHRARYHIFPIVTVLLFPRSQRALLRFLFCGFVFFFPFYQYRSNFPLFPSVLTCVSCQDRIRRRPSLSPPMAPLRPLPTDVVNPEPPSTLLSLSRPLAPRPGHARPLVAA